MEENKRVLVSEMKHGRRIDWNQQIKKTGIQKRRSRRILALAASFSVLAAGVTLSMQPEAKMVMGQMSTGFEYDESLGRLQFVSNILPESAMVFLQSHEDSNVFHAPIDAHQTHVWCESEPWIEYASYEPMVSCEDGEIMNIVESRKGVYTVRILHDNGYESISSGLCDLQVKTGELVDAGQTIGMSGGNAAYELRKDGVSIRPVFAQSGETDAD